MIHAFAHAWRSWKKNKAVATFAIAALALGIGCATAVFTVADAVMLKPLPYSQPDRWVALWGGTTNPAEAHDTSGLSYADLKDYRQRTSSFDAFGWYEVGGDFNVSAPGLAEHVEGTAVTPSLLGDLGVNPVRGRLFQDSDGPNAVVISSRLWSELGSAPSIVGRSVKLNGQLCTVTGVMPAGFQLPLVTTSSADAHQDVWIPIMPPKDATASRGNFNYAGYARLKPDVSVQQGRADAEHVAAQIRKENPDATHDASYTVRVFGLQEFVAREVRPYLLLFLAAAALLLLVTCANVAGLLVARSVSRSHETAVRVAIGARRRDLALQFIAEGLMLSLPAAGLGLLASIGLTRLVLSLAAASIPRASEIAPGRIVLLFVAALASVAALFPSLAPLWQALRSQPNEILSNGVRASASARSRTLSKSLVAAETALAFVLLAVSGLLISELQNLRRTPPGFDPNHLTAFQMSAGGEDLSGAKKFAAHQEQILNSLAALPGVDSAALSNRLPLGGCCMVTTFRPEGQPLASGSLRTVNFVVVSADYFATMRIPLEKGRFLTAADTGEDPVSIVIDASAANRYWPNQDPIGQIALVGDFGTSRARVIGVVGDVRNRGLGEATTPEIYFLDSLQTFDPIDFIVRSDLPEASLIPAIRSTMQKIEPDRAVYSMRSEDEIIAGSVLPQRLDSVVLAFFALSAFLMAALGIYGVMSYSVRERTVEIGTRMAVGAQPRDLLRLVLRDGLTTTAYGILAGIPLAAAATWFVFRYMSLHHIALWPYVASAGMVTGVTVLASVFPGWRATLVTPMVAIRNQSESLLAVAQERLERKVALAAAENESLVSPALLTELADASRRAESFSEALSIALSELRQEVRVQFAILLESFGTPATEYRLRAASPHITEASNIPADGFLIGRLKFHSAPLFFTDDELNTVLHWAREQNPRRVQEVEYLKKTGIRTAVALRTKSEIVGLLLLGGTLNDKSYSFGDKELLQVCAQQLALMIENARLTDRMVEQEKVRRDVELAAEVQQRLLPEKSIENGQVSIAAFTLPARGVGGDCHDFLELANNEIGVALADVSGKGVAAALIMAAIQCSLRIFTSEKQIPPAELAAKMNSFLFQSTGFDRYATFFFAQLDPARHRLRYVNAGHNPPYLMRISGSPSKPSGAEIEELKTGGTVIGMFPVAEYEEAMVGFEPGDVLLIFTDGVTEALNPHREEFGEDRLKALLRRIAQLPVGEIISSIAGELRDWIADAPQHDDMTFIVAKVH